MDIKEITIYENKKENILLGQNFKIQNEGNRNLLQAKQYLL